MKKKKEKKQKMQLIYNIELSNVVRGRWKVYFLILLKSPIGAILRSEKQIHLNSKRVQNGKEMLLTG